MSNLEFSPTVPYQEWVRFEKENLRQKPGNENLSKAQLQILAQQAYREYKTQIEQRSFLPPSIVNTVSPASKPMTQNPKNDRKRVQKAEDCPSSLVYNPRSGFCVDILGPTDKKYKLSKQAQGLVGIVWSGKRQIQNGNQNQKSPPNNKINNNNGMISPLLKSIPPLTYLASLSSSSSFSNNTIGPEEEVNLEQEPEYNQQNEQEEKEPTANAFPLSFITTPQIGSPSSFTGTIAGKNNNSSLTSSSSSSLSLKKSNKLNKIGTNNNNNNNNNSKNNTIVSNYLNSNSIMIDNNDYNSTRVNVGTNVTNNNKTTNSGPKPTSKQVLNLNSIGYTQGIDIRQELRDISEIYDIQQILGEGSFGAVYKVFRKSDGKVRALKKVELAPLDEKEKAAKKEKTDFDKMQAIETAKLEIRIALKTQVECSLERLDCALAQVFDFFIDATRDYFYIESQYIVGGDGEAIVEQKPEVIGEDFTPFDFVFNFYRIASTLDLMHDQCLLHRDLKPANILWETKTKFMYLTDFGISCFGPQCTPFKSARGPQLIGTAAYIDPRIYLQLQDAPGVNSDIFALGLTFFSMIFHQNPFHDILYEFDKINIIQIKQPNQNDKTFAAIYKLEASAYKKAQNMIANAINNMNDDHDENVNHPSQQFKRLLLAIIEMIEPFESDPDRPRPALSSLINYIRSEGRLENLKSKFVEKCNVPSFFYKESLRSDYYY